MLDKWYQQKVMQCQNDGAPRGTQATPSERTYYNDKHIAMFDERYPDLNRGIDPTLDAQIEWVKIGCTEPTNCVVSMW